MASSWHNRHQGTRYAVLDVVTERGNKGYLVATWDRALGKFVIDGPTFVHLVDAHEHAQDVIDGRRSREAALREVERHLAEAATRVDGELTGGVSATWENDETIGAPKCV